MDISELHEHMVQTAREVRLIPKNDRATLDQQWQPLFGRPMRDRRGYLTGSWVEKGAIELYRAERPDEFLVLPYDWKYPALRCRGGILPEFGFDGVCVTPTDLGWAMVFTACDLEGGPYFARRESNASA